MMKFVKKLLVISILLGIFIFTMPSIQAQEKEILDLRDVEWNETTFFFDNTEKEVRLLHVPEQKITVRYLQNKGTEIHDYTATAEFSYDENRYQIINFDYSKLSHRWEIVKGSYDISEMRFNPVTVIEDGEYHSIYVQNLPEGLEVEYSDNNSQKDPGRYPITATFTGNPYYERVSSKEALLTIRRKRLWTEQEDACIISDGWGFDPDLTFHFNWKSKDDYQNMDLTKVGAYREVKAVFGLNLELNNEHARLDHSVKARISIPDDLANAKDLAIYDYSSGQLVSMASSIEADEIVFNVSELSDQYLVIGSRDTYTSNSIWKAFLIFGICLLFIVMLFIARFIYKRKRG